MNKVTEAIRRSARTIVVWAVIIVVIAIMVQQNRAKQAAAEDAILNPATCEATVTDLVQNGALVDVLSNSLDPNGDADSPANKRSIRIRETAAAMLDKVVVENKLPAEPELATLFGLHKDGDGKVKDMATAGLASFGSASDVNLAKLTNYLKDGDPDVRSAVTDGLGKIGGDKVAKLVSPLIKDQVAGDSALTVLSGLGLIAVPYVEQHLDDPDPDFRQKMVELIGKLGDPTTIPTLIKTTQNDLPAVRRVAIIALTQIVQSTETAKNPAGQPTASAADLALANSAEPTLIDVVKDPADDSDVRSQAALTLGYTASPSAIQGLVATLGDYDLRVAEAAQTGVMTAGAAAVTPLVQTLKNGNARSEASAAEALGAIQSGPALDALRAAMNDPATPVDVRRNAVIGLGLGKTANTDAVGILVSSLADRDGLVADAASASLLNPDYTSLAIPQLVSAFRKPSPVPFVASQTLVRMSGEARDAVVAALQAGLSSKDAATQTWSAVTFGQGDIKDPNAIAYLDQLEQTGSTTSVRWAASQAAEQLSGA